MCICVRRSPDAVQKINQKGDLLRTSLRRMASNNERPWHIWSKFLDQSDPSLSSSISEFKPSSPTHEYDIVRDQNVPEYISIFFISRKLLIQKLGPRNFWWGVYCPWQSDPFLASPSSPMRPDEARPGKSTYRIKSLWFRCQKFLGPPKLAFVCTILILTYIIYRIFSMMSLQPGQKMIYTIQQKCLKKHQKKHTKTIARLEKPHLRKSFQHCFIWPDGVQDRCENPELGVAQKADPFSIPSIGMVYVPDLNEKFDFYGKM